MIKDTKLSPDAGYALYTYYNYVKAWIINLENSFGTGKSGMDRFLANIKSSSDFANLKNDTGCTTEVRAHYLRGKFTLISMMKFPIDDHPELSISANMWLPVQAYYAIHGVGLSVLAVLKQRPKNHRAFLTCFANIICRYLPSPLSACCDGGPDISSFTFNNISTSHNQVARQSNIANPKYSQGDHFIGKSLSTTRGKNIKDLCDKARQQHRGGCKRRNLCRTERANICHKLPPTTICDFIYRMRVRSNYEDPDMYLFAYENVQDAASHYKDLLHFTDIIVTGMECVIEKKIGTREMLELRDLVALSKHQ